MIKNCLPGLGLIIIGVITVVILQCFCQLLVTDFENSPVSPCLIRFELFSAYHPWISGFTTRFFGKDSKRPEKQESSDSNAERRDSRRELAS
jgi:hypothetical protein